MNFLWAKPFVSLGATAVIAVIGIGALLKINVNDIAHLETAVTSQTEKWVSVQRETNEVLRGMTKAVEQNASALNLNTQVLNQLLINGTRK